MKHSIQFISKILIVLVVPLFLIAKVYQLDLEQSLDRAMEQSYRMRTLREDLNQAEFQLKVATHMFRTNVEMNFTLPDYTETIQQFQDSLGTYYTYLKQSTYEGNLTINQPLPTDGNLYIRAGVYTLQDFHRERTDAKLSTRIGFTQPLEAFFTYNSLKASLEEAELEYERQQKQLDRAKLDMEYRITNAFFQLVKSRERKKISKQALKNQQEAYDLALNKYKAGVIPEVQALQMEVDLGEAQNSYETNRSRAREVANDFKQLLDIALSDSVDLSYDLQYQVVYVDKSKAVDLALQNRLEIQEQKINKRLAKLEIKRRKVNGQITGNISGYYDFQGVDRDKIHPAYSELFQGAYENLTDRPGNRGVALTLSIPVWDWGVNEARVEAARSRLRQAEYAVRNEKVNVKKDVIATVDQLRTSLNNLKLLEKNVKVAEKSYNISKKRFANGDISSQELALERDRLNKTHISHLEAFINYKLSLADLKRKTFYDFKKDKSIL
ncbi:MAG: TolC family protein [Candidatus Marinimicrobia bacterium]|nr:TolC family protein [Candidatus Neomarinimicrobiota bacterium]